MINHYFDLQIRVTTDYELGYEDQIAIQNYIRERLLASNLGSLIRVDLSSVLHQRINEVYIDDVWLDEIEK